MGTNDKDASDLVLHHTGEEVCAPRHRWRSVRDYYLFHYVISGSGSATFPRGPHALGSGEGFLFVPGELSDYQADADTPWHYLWLAFNGRHAERFLKGLGLGADDEHRIYRSKAPEHSSRALTRIVARLGEDPPFFEKTALLYRAFAVLDADRMTDRGPGIPFNPDSGIASDYIAALHEWIHGHYQEPSASVQGMADRLGLSRTYLSTLVKKRTGKTPQELLLGYRMFMARECLTNSSSPVAAIARQVGYPDPLSFSRSYKRWFGLSPRETRRRSGAGESIEG